MQVRSLLTFILLLLSLNSYASLKEELANYNINLPSASDYELTTNLKRSSSKRTYHNLVSKNKLFRIEFEIITPIEQADADRLLKIKDSTFKRLFIRQPTPYKGQVITMQECPSDLKPQNKEITIANYGKIVIRMAGVTDRFTFGVCEPQSIKHQGGWSNFWIENKKMFLVIKAYPLAAQTTAQARAEIVNLFSQFQIK